MNKQKCRGHKEDSDSKLKLVNQNNSFPLCPICFYLSMEAQFLGFFYLYIFCFRSILAKPKVYILVFSNTKHLHRMCNEVSFSAPHLLHKEVLTLLILCSIYCRLICPVRSPTNILQCFLSSLRINGTYLSVGTSRHNWLVP